jgi:hypothetical protein
MRFLPIIMATVCVAVLSSWACVSPANIEGVAFTSGETIDLQKLMDLGVENVNYMTDGKAPDIGVRYRSHYDSRAMVYVGRYGMSYQQNVIMNCMGVVLPLPDSAKEYSPISRDEFDFGAAVKTELAWLASKGIVALTAGTIDTIAAALDASFNGGVQYWTHADQVLGYNSWYVQDTLTGVWSSGGVRDVNGVYAVQGCSIIQPGSGLPPEGIGTTSVRSKRAVFVHQGDALLAVRRLCNGGTIVFLNPVQSPGGATIVVFDCRGAIAARRHVPAGARSLYIDGLAPGHYTARFVH